MNRRIREGRATERVTEPTSVTASVALPAGARLWFGPTVAPVSTPPNTEPSEPYTVKTASQLSQGTSDRPSSPSSRVTAAVVVKPEKAIAMDTVLPLEKWIGIVTSVEAETFRARVTEQFNGEVDEEVEFPVRAVSEGDLEFLQTGSVFYWVIGYRETARGTRMNASTVRFRRLPPWDEAELMRARDEARSLRGELGWPST